MPDARTTPDSRIPRLLKGMLFGQGLWVVAFSVLTSIAYLVGTSRGTHEPNDFLVVFYLILGAPLILALPFSDNTGVVAACGFVFGLGIYGLLGATAAGTLGHRTPYQISLRTMLTITTLVAVVMGLVVWMVR